MTITIHRGTKQIGGCVTEIEHDGYKLFIDFGEQLPGAVGSNLPPIDGLTAGNVSKSALFFTHYHGDHIGKVCDVSPDIPMYMGETAREIYLCLEKRLSHNHDKTVAVRHEQIVGRIEKCRTFTASSSVHFGPFVIIPLMIDHSAFDAYMFVVEVVGIRILHTGDFRGHGIRSKALPIVLRRYANNIDYVISEGTNVCRPNVTSKDEHSLQADFVKEFRKSKYNFVIVSSTNIDRIFLLRHAARKAGRFFVCDDFQKKIMRIVENKHGCKSDLYKIGTGFYPLERDRQFNDIFYCPQNLEDKLRQKGFCMLVRTSEVFKRFIDMFYDKQNTGVYLSMWNGYVDSQSPAYNTGIVEFLSPYSYKYMHTSGHCDVSTLKNVLNIVKPKKGIIPIHTDYPEKFDKLFGGISPVIHLHDGEKLKCTDSFDFK